MTSSPTVLSLFSGVGGFDLGLEAAGMRTGALCEIDPWCQKVLRRHWPDIPIYTDVSTLTATRLLADGVRPDVVAFGSPCQDLSIAGRRAGLAGSRSGLFGEAVRIIRELRKETDGTYPRVAVWENVVGALSSSQGDDFGAVLDSLADAGAMVLEWAVLDAQHFGVPQRRRRIFLVAIFNPRLAGECPDPLLPVREGRPGDLAKGRKARQDAARRASASPGSGGAERTADIAATLNSGGNTGGFRTEPGEHLVVEPSATENITYDTSVGDPVLMRQREGKPGGGKGPLLSDDSSLTLGTSNDQYLFQPADEQVVMLNFQGSKGNSVTSEDDLSFTLNAMHGHDVHVVGQPVVYEPRSMGDENWAEQDVKNALRAGASRSSHVVVEPVQHQVPVDLYNLSTNDATWNALTVRPLPTNLGVLSTQPDEPSDTPVAYGFDSTFSWQSTVHEEQAPTLKVGSGLGIPSPPAVGQSVKPGEADDPQPSADDAR